MYRPFRRIGERLAKTTTFVHYTHIARIRGLVSRGILFFREYFSVHQALVTLTIFILASNALVVRASNEEYILEAQTVALDPYSIADTVRVLAPYMTDITQDPDAIAVALEEQITGSFISTNPLIATLPGQTDEPTPPAPKPQEPSPPKKRSSDIKYAVEIGDTLSGIAREYGVSLDTLRVKNNLKNVDSIKPGQTLVIPPADLSQKAIAAADSRAKIASSAAAISTSPKTGGWGLVLPIRHNGVTRRLVGGHTGVDYRANTGTPVYAAASGIITNAERGWNGGYGVNVLIHHGSGMTTRYAHLNSYVVIPGQSVSQGQLIAYSGNSGRSTGPHLHFELRVNGVPRDPQT